MSKNSTRSKKFGPKFHPSPLQVTEVGDYGLLPENPTNGRTLERKEWKEKKLLMYILLRLWRELQLTLLSEPLFHAQLSLLDKRDPATGDRPSED